jgi:hypothetical protein
MASSAHYIDITKCVDKQDNSVRVARCEREDMTPLRLLKCSAPWKVRIYAFIAPLFDARPFFAHFNA